MDPAIVELITLCYYEHVRKCVSSLEYPRVMVPELGVFEAKPWAVAKKAHYIRSFVGEQRPAREQEQKILDLDGLLVKEAEERKQFKQYRKSYINESH